MVRQARKAVNSHGRIFGATCSTIPGRGESVLSSLESHDIAAQSRERRAVLLGVAFWSAFSFIAVIVRGVSWDETYEHALAITRIAPYPEGHPFYIYIRNIYSLQSYLSAGLLFLTKGPLVLCFLRDAVTMLLTTLPLYFLAVTLTKRALWGYVAVVLGLSNAYIFFASHYGIGVWPGYYSVGAIGAGYALLLFTLFIAGWTRAAWFFLTLLMSVHLGHWPPLAMFAGLHLLHWNAATRHAHWRAAFIWGGAGLAIDVLFFAVLRFFHVAYPTEGAYYAEGDAHAIWINYSMREDVHRFAEYLHPYSYSVLLMLIVFVVGVLALATEKRGNRMFALYAAILVYAGCVTFLSGGIRLIHAIVGENIPFLLIGWMPYRIPNHLAPILLCMLLAILARGAGESRHYNAELWAARITILAFPVAAGGAVLPEWFFERYLAGGEYLLFFLLGGTLGVLMTNLLHTSKERLYTLSLLVVVAGISLAWFNQFIFACTLAGAGFHAFIRIINTGREPRFNWARICAACVAIVLGVHLVREWVHRENFPRTAFQQGVFDYLAQSGEPHAMIIPPIWTDEWSARLSVPVFADYGTPRYVTYIPALGPALKKMHRDVFGFNVDGTPNDELQPPEKRTREEWKRLSEEYGFRYIVQPQDVPLDLNAVYEADGLVLYAID